MAKKSTCCSNGRCQVTAQATRNKNQNGVYFDQIGVFSDSILHTDFRYKLFTEPKDHMTMQSALDTIIKGHGGIYSNVHNILISVDAHGYIVTSCQWPGFEGDEDLSLVCICNDSQFFLKLLGIEDFKQLKRIKPKDILALFQAGKALAVCSIDDKASLEFEITDKTITATTGTSYTSHKVKDTLEKANDFIDYTRSYFLVHKD